MRVVRTILWILLLAALLLFSFTNWQDVTIRIWDNLVVETKLPALLVLAFLLGLVPMWLLYRARVWNLKRRIASLESSVRSSALAVPPAAGPDAAVATPAPAGTPHPFGEPL